MGHQIRTEVMTLEEIKAKSADNFVEEVVPVSLGEIIEGDFESFLDILSDRVIGEEGILTDIEYDIVGTGMYNDLHIKVRGYADLVGEE